MSGETLSSRPRTEHTCWTKLQGPDGVWRAYRPIAVERARLMGIPEGCSYGDEHGEKAACILVANGIEHNIACMLAQRTAAYLRKYYTALVRKAIPFSSCDAATRDFGSFDPATGDLEVIDLGVMLNNMDCGSEEGLVDSGAGVWWWWVLFRVRCCLRRCWCGCWA